MRVGTKLGALGPGADVGKAVRLSVSLAEKSSFSLADV